MSQPHDEQLEKSLYRNWVKAALALKYLKAGITDVVDNAVKGQQTSFLAEIGNTRRLKSVTCGRCTTENVITCPTKGICYTQGKDYSYLTAGKLPRLCPNKVCDTLVDKIITQHRYGSPSWKNTDATKWCSDHWELAKCFISDSGYNDKSTAAETDCSGILSVAMNGLFMENVLAAPINLPGDILSKIGQACNTILHSSDLEVTDDQLVQYINDMIDLLNDKKQLVNHPDAIKARQKLNQLKTDELDVTSKDVEEIRKERYLLRKNSITTENKSLRLWEMTTGDINRLEVVHIQNIKHPEGDKGHLVLILNNQKHLKTLDFKDIIGCIELIDLTECINLTHLKIDTLTTECIILPQQGCLQKIDLKSIKHPKGNKGHLVLNINDQEHLKTLNIINITGVVDQIELSGCSSLTYLGIAKVTTDSIILPQKGDPSSLDQSQTLDLKGITTENKSLRLREVKPGAINLLEVVHMQNIKHPEGDKGHLVLNLNNQKHLRTLDLKDIIGFIELIDLTECINLTHLKTDTLTTESIILPQQGCLKKVDLKRIKHPKGDKCHLVLNINDQEHLETLKIINFKRVIDQIDLDGCSSLTYLGIATVTTGSIILPQQRDSSSLDQSQTLDIKGITTENQSLSLREVTIGDINRLEEVHIQNIKHPEGDKGHLVINLNNQKNLKTLDLEDIIGCIELIDLTECMNLTHLKIDALTTESIILPQQGCLQKVDFKGIKHPKRDKGHLVLNINDQEHLETLNIINIKGVIDQIDLSGCRSLTCLCIEIVTADSIILPQQRYPSSLDQSQTLDMKGITTENKSLRLREVKPGDMNKLEVVHIQNIKHPEGDKCHLVINLNNQKHLKTLDLEDIIGFIMLIDLTECINLTHLKIDTLTTEIIILPQQGCLQKVDLTSIKHPKGDKGHLVLNINDQEHLETLIIINFTGAIDQIDMSGCSSLTYLGIAEVTTDSIIFPQQRDSSSLDQSQTVDMKGIRTENQSLRLREVKLGDIHRLEEDNLENIKHPEGDKCLLVINLNNQKHLKTLDLKDIIGFIMLIDLTECINLTHLTIDTLTTESIILPQQGCLQKVDLENINHPKGDKGHLVLNINDQEHLETLNIINFTGVIDQIDLCRCSNLTCLCIATVTADSIILPQQREPCSLDQSQTLDLKGITTENKSLRLREVKLGDINRLVVVHIQAINHPEGDKGHLLLNLNNQSYLNTLVVRDIKSCIEQIDLTGCINLKYLAIYTLTTESIILPQQGCLVEINLQDIKHPEGDKGHLVLNLNIQKYLKTLDLKGITGCIEQIDLTECINLKTLKIASLTASSVTLPQQTDSSQFVAVQSLDIKGITPGNESLRLREVELCDINPPDVCEQLLRYLQNQSGLEELTLSEITSEEHVISMVGSLHKLPQVRRLWIRHIDFGTKALTIPDNMVKLEDVRLDRCMMTPVNWRTFVRSVIQLKQSMHIALQLCSLDRDSREYIRQCPYVTISSTFNTSDWMVFINRRRILRTVY